MTGLAPIWIDLDNAPHAHFFAPLVRELEALGQPLIITTRNFGQTEALASSYGMTFTSIGSHGMHRQSVSRVFETLHRAARLVAFAASERPVAAVSHGSRALTIAAAILGIPSMVLFDYEHISADVFRYLCRRVLVPEIVLQGRANGGREIGYPGFKEDVYIHDFHPDSRILEQLQLDPEKLIVTLRPPATWAHYYNEHSLTLFRALIECLRFMDAQIVVLARTAEQAQDLASKFGLDRPPFRLLSDAVDGLSLICVSDAVFSGGGTMVREAALLGTAAYSTFAGKPGTVDKELERLGKLTVLRTPEQVLNLKLCKRPRILNAPQSRTRSFILHEIIALANTGALYERPLVLR